MPFSQGTASTPARWHRWWTMTGLSPPGSSPATRPIPSGRPDDRISKSMSSAAGWDPDLSLRAPASPSEILPRRIRRGWDPMKEGGSAIAAVRGAGMGPACRDLTKSCLIDHSATGSAMGWGSARRTSPSASSPTRLRQEGVQAQAQHRQARLADLVVVGDDLRAALPCLPAHLLEDLAEQHQDAAGAE